MKKKIIFITKALWIGGIETALVNMLRYMDYSRYDVTLLVLTAELDLLPRIPAQCRVIVSDRDKVQSAQEPYRFSKLFHLTEEPENPSMLHRMMMWLVPAIKWVENRLYIRYVKDLLQGEQFDTAIIYSDVAGETAIRAVKANQYLMFYHHGAMRRVYHDEIAWKKCRKIIAVSNNQAKLLREFVPRYAKKITVIHNLTDVTGIRAKASEQTSEVFDRTRFNIVSVGRVSHEKGMDIAVRACAKLVVDGFDNVRWWIVGDGPAMQEVRDVIAETHMEDYVIAVGMKHNPYPFIRQADLYVQPSRFEGYPMTILEALILGQFVVSTDNNGAREILEEGITGMLRPIDADQIADAIEELLQEPDRLKKMRDSISDMDFEKENIAAVASLELLIEWKG